MENGTASTTGKAETVPRNIQQRTVQVESLQPLLLTVLRKNVFKQREQVLVLDQQLCEQSISDKRTTATC